MIFHCYVSLPEGIYIICGEQNVLPQIQFVIGIGYEQKDIVHGITDRPCQKICGVGTGLENAWEFPTGNLTHLWPVENSQFIDDLPSYNMVMSCDVPFS